MNRFDFIGHVTRDPELKYVSDGLAVTTLGLASNRKFKDKEETTFIDVEFWSKQAEIICEYVKKGKQVYVSGRHKNESWEDKETGEKRSRLKLVGEDFQFLGKKEE